MHGLFMAKDTVKSSKGYFSTSRESLKNFIGFLEAPSDPSAGPEEVKLVVEDEVQDNPKLEDPIVWINRQTTAGTSLFVSSIPQS